MPKKSLLVETGMAMQDTLNLLCPFMMIRLSWEVVGERTKNGKEWGRGRETWLKSFTSAPKGICNVCRDVRISMQLRMSAKEGGEVPRLLSMARCRVTILPHSPGSCEENRSQRGHPVGLAHKPKPCVHERSREGDTE